MVDQLVLKIEMLKNWWARLEEKMKDERKMSLRELEKLEEVKVEFDRDAFKAKEITCPKCDIKTIKYFETKNLFHGVLKMQIKRFKCPKCKSKYFDLEGAELHDLFLMLRRLNKNEALKFIAESKARPESVKLVHAEMASR